MAIKQLPFEKHMPAILAIEQANFPYPWDRADFNAMLAVGADLCVCEAKRQVVGYAVARYFKWGTRIENLSISRSHQHHGLGASLIRYLLRALPAGQKLQAIVDDKNLKSHLFFRAMGMKCIRIRHDYFCNGQDAYVFEVRK